MSYFEPMAKPTNRFALLQKGSSGLLTDPARAALMARVRQKGTTPELAVRQILRSRGLRFTSNARKLPGSPDLVDVGSRRAVFVHGCFWHRHARCVACTTPSRNSAFWQKKFADNQTRDARNVRQLRRMGFRVMTIWECQLKSATKLRRLEQRIDRFFCIHE